MEFRKKIGLFSLTFLKMQSATRILYLIVLLLWIARARVFDDIQDSRNSLATEGQIEEFGNQTYFMRAKFYKRAPGDGSCLYHSVRLALEAQLREEFQQDGDLLAQNLPTSTEIRHEMLKEMFEYYSHHASKEQKAALDRTIANMYFPSLNVAGKFETMKTRYFVIGRANVASCEHKIKVSAFRKKINAQEDIYSRYAEPVNSVPAYIKYMGIVSRESSKYVTVSMSYRKRSKEKNGLKFRLKSAHLSSATTWGDDIAIEALAAVWRRPIAVVLKDHSYVIVLKYQPLWTISHSTDNKPIVLTMNSSQNIRGGVHYDSMIATFQPLD